MTLTVRLLFAPLMRNDRGYLRVKGHLTPSG
jgi:hypothetical protein